MKYYLFTLLLFVFCAFIACESGNNSERENLLNLELIEKDTVVDVISGYSREDLMSVFLNEICNPIDSLCQICQKQILNNWGESDYNANMELIEQTIKMIEYKSDKLEKFRVYQVDRNCKSMMLEFLKQYKKMMIDFYIPIVSYELRFESLDEVENENADIFRQFELKKLEQRRLYEEILKDYYYHHNRT